MILDYLDVILEFPWIFSGDHIQILIQFGRAFNKINPVDDILFFKIIIIQPKTIQCAFFLMITPEFHRKVIRYSYLDIEST